MKSEFNDTDKRDFDAKQYANLNESERQKLKTKFVERYAKMQDERLSLREIEEEVKEIKEKRHKRRSAFHEAFESVKYDE